MKKKILLGWILILITGFPLLAAAESEGDSRMVHEMIRSRLDQLQTEQVEDFWKQIAQDYEKYLDGQSSKDIFDLILSGENGLSLKNVLSGLIRYFFDEVLYNGKLLGSIIILTVFSMILQTLQTAFEQNQVSKVAYAIVFMVVIILAVNSFYVAVDSAKLAIGRMTDFMLSLVPLMMTLMVTMGNVVSVSLFHPLIVFMIHIIGTLIYTVVFPLLFFFGGAQHRQQHHGEVQSQSLGGIVAQNRYHFIGRAVGRLFGGDFHSGSHQCGDRRDYASNRQIHHGEFCAGGGKNHFRSGRHRHECFFAGEKHRGAFRSADPPVYLRFPGVEDIIACLYL